VSGTVSHNLHGHGECVDCLRRTVNRQTSRNSVHWRIAWKNPGTEVIRLCGTCDHENGLRRGYADRERFLGTRSILCLCPLRNLGAILAGNWFRNSLLRDRKERRARHAHERLYSMFGATPRCGSGQDSPRAGGAEVGCGTGFAPCRPAGSHRSPSPHVVSG
jgi:hypothetical protein